MYKPESVHLRSERGSSWVADKLKVIRGRASADGIDGKRQVPGSAISGQALNQTRLELLQPELEATDSWAADKVKLSKTGNSALEVSPRSTLWTAGAASSHTLRVKNTPCRYYSRPGGCGNGENCRYLQSSPEERHSRTVSGARETATRARVSPRSPGPSDPQAGTGAGILWGGSESFRFLVQFVLLPGRDCVYAGKLAKFCLSIAHEYFRCCLSRPVLTEFGS